MYTTGGTVTDNLAVAPSDVNGYTVMAPSDARLPGGGANSIGPLYNLNPPRSAGSEQPVPVDQGQSATTRACSTAWT